MNGWVFNVLVSLSQKKNHFMFTQPGSANFPYARQF